MKKLLFVLLGFLLLFSGIACSNNTETPPQETAGSQSAEPSDNQQATGQQQDSQRQQNSEPQQNTQSGKDNTNTPTTPAANAKNPVVTIEMADGGIIKMELYPQLAPNTVKNFISLVKKGFYNGTIFHRVIPGFMIQGGDPQGTGMGDPGYSIKGEFANNGFSNNLKHERGVVSMARSTIPDSAGSQFFIMVEKYPSLDGDYAAFGKVIDGMEIADKIVSVDRNADDRPLKEQKMKQLTVDTFGVDYGEPEIIK